MSVSSFVRVFYKEGEELGRGIIRTEVFIIHFEHSDNLKAGVRFWFHGSSELLAGTSTVLLHVS